MFPSNNSYLVLPSKQLPLALSHFTQPLSQTFLFGYRNVLIQNESGISWGLVKDLNYCGKAYLFQLSEAQSHNIQFIKTEGQTLQVVGQNYILLTNNQLTRKPTHTFSQEQQNLLISSIGGISKLNLNLFKNAFNSYEDFLELTNKIASFATGQHKQADLTVSEKADIFYFSNKLSGKNLLEVPTISKQNANTNQHSSIKLKLINL